MRSGQGVGGTANRYRGPLRVCSARLHFADRLWAGAGGALGAGGDRVGFAGGRGLSFKTFVFWVLTRSSRPRSSAMGELSVPASGSAAVGRSAADSVVSRSSACGCVRGLGWLWGS